MGIGAELHRLHVAEWDKRFQNYKRSWIKYLFRHEPIENAIAILKSGELLSRSMASQNTALVKDIAPVDIIQTREDAHDFVRLYFRPRTPTQFHIEGIRKEVDYYKNCHGGFLVMMAFDAESVLSMESTCFSSGNMQSAASIIKYGESGFKDLDFSGIYHDEYSPSDDQRRKRCAEVLVQSPLTIQHNLAALIVRTDADVATLKHLLIKENLNFLLPLIRKSDGSGVFFHNYTAVKYIDTAPGRINFELAPTKNGTKIHVKSIAKNVASGIEYPLFTGELDPMKRYYTSHACPQGDYVLTFHLEECFAHESLVTLSPD